jgi:rod shape-determining protein MreD
MTPYLFLYIVLKVRVDIGHTTLLFIGFFTGLILDIFQNTLGMQAAATTALAFVRPYTLNLFFKTSDFQPKERPSLNRFKFGGFLKYVVVAVFVHHTVLFFLEAFTFHHFFQTLEKAFFNTLFTSSGIFVIEMLTQKKEK